MEPIIAIFKVGTGFYKACKEYLLIKKVDELQHDVELIKGSFFSNAIDFVEKASVCENIENTRFFLESAYNSFSQSVKMYSNSMDKLMGSLISYTLKDGFADFIKTEGSNVLTRSYNKCVDGAKEKVTASDKAKIEQHGKECEVLEMSFIGKSMCEFYMKEHTLCLNSIDAALGVNYLPNYKTLVVNPIIKMTQHVFNDHYSSPLTSVFWRLLSSRCVVYLQIMNELGSEYSISLDGLPNRKRLVILLQKEPNSCWNYERRMFLELLQII